MVIARVQTLVQLTDELVADLDAEAERRGVSRSALIRDAIESFLAAESDAAKVRAWVDGYRRVPQPTIDEWGNLDEQTDALTPEPERW